MTLKEQLKIDGRSQTWLNKKLRERRMGRNKSQMSLWANDLMTPRDEYIIENIAEILGHTEEHVYSLFSTREQRIRNGTIIE